MNALRIAIPLLCLLGWAPANEAQDKIFGSKPRRTGTGIIPEDRLADWRPGITVGVPGGIPTDRKTLIDVTKPPFNADNTGAADAQPAIVQAIAKAAPNEVVYLPAGTYRLNAGLWVGAKSKITIRGDGPDKTIVRGTISVGTGGGDWWYPDRLKVDLAAGAQKGATVLTVADPKALDALPNGGVGMLCHLSLKNDPKLPVIVPAPFEYLRNQVTRIVGRTEAGGVKISPALQFDLPLALAPRMRPTARSVEGVGIEDLAVDGSTVNLQTGITLSTAWACWIKNVSVTNITNYHVSVSDALQCEVRHSTIMRRKGSGSNGAGILVGTTSSTLFEDNILAEQFPHVEVNASTANVFAYNLCYDSTIQGVVGCSINSNHGAHSNLNLYEGNVSPKFQADGYHGSSSHDTVFRNWLHGSSEKTSQFWICVSLNRFTRAYSIVGNVLGSKGHPWVYDNQDKGFGYDQHLIYALGMPNMGNGGFSGTAQLSKGRPWADLTRIQAGEKPPGPGGFQELDLDVRATTLIKGNYNYKHNAVPENESLGGAGLPKSLYLTQKPAWFGTLAWPPFGPDTAFENNKIPAQVRFEALRK
jgi:hypothetical protein